MRPELRPWGLAALAYWLLTGRYLIDDVGPGRSDGAPDADLSGPLGHCCEHDVHDTDATDDQRDGGDQSEEEHEHKPRGTCLL